MKTTEKTITNLNKLLATYQVHYQNLRGLHWNIKGGDFFEIHAKYEELYLRVQEIIDELAERILTVGSQPLHTYSNYLKSAQIKENKTISDSSKGMKYVFEAQRVILDLERKILELSSENNDEGTSALMSDLIREKEKTNWMFKAWLTKK